MMQVIDSFLYRITMYRLVLYGLATIAGAAVILGFTGNIPFDGLRLIYSCLILLVICYGVNKFLAFSFGAAANTESSLITALILFCIFSPPRNVSQAIILGLVGAIAMASKYVLAFRQRHIFNPAAIAAVIVAIIGLTQASWWIATPALLPLVGALGLAIVRKIHRLTMAAVFAGVALAWFLVMGLGDGRNVATILDEALTVWPLAFFGGIMLTEPLTTPPTQKMRLLYAGLIGFLFAAAPQVGQFTLTPEIALVLGNLFSFAVGLRQRVVLRLKSAREIAANTFEFIFSSTRPFTHQPGQYMEVTLPHSRPDARGNRRYFTIASSPTEKDIKIGVKFNEPSSSFKQKLRTLKEGSTLNVPQVAGDFLLPADPRQKLLFIAGGIGVTPFRSMAQYLIDKNEQRDIILFYAAADQNQLAYSDVFTRAQPNGLKVVPVLSKAPAGWQGETGFVTGELVQKYAPDFADRVAYLSGPPPMVDANKKLLHQMKVRHIRTDYFAGY